MRRRRFTLQRARFQIPPAPTPNTSTSGCEAVDFAGFPAGAIAIVQRGTCTFAVKAANAQAAGASAVVIFNEGQPGRTDLFSGTLGGPGTTISRRREGADRIPDAGETTSTTAPTSRH